MELKYSRKGSNSFYERTKKWFYRGLYKKKKLPQPMGPIPSEEGTVRLFYPQVVIRQLIVITLKIDEMNKAREITKKYSRYLLRGDFRVKTLTKDYGTIVFGNGESIELDRGVLDTLLFLTAIIRGGTTPETIDKVFEITKKKYLLPIRET